MDKNKGHDWDRTLNKIAPFSPIRCKKCGAVRRRDGKNEPCKREKEEI